MLHTFSRTLHCINVSSLKFLWWAPEIVFISARVTFRPFKVIQGH